MRKKILNNKKNDLFRGISHSFGNTVISIFNTG